MEEERREDRPGGLQDTPSPDLPQDPGAPGAKLPADEPGQGAEARVEKDPDEWVSGAEPMTPAQASYLQNLCRQANEEFDESLTKAQASKRIDELRAKTGKGSS
jgi:hypothetical protein